MNKTETINTISQTTGIELEKCNRQDKNSEKGAANLIAKVALSSDTGIEESRQELDALADIQNYQLETSRSARIKFKITHKLVDFFPINNQNS